MVLGADAISAVAGVTSHSGAEADVARMMAERTRGDVVCVVDNTKWGTTADHVVLPASRLSRVITDGLPNQEQRRLKQAGVQIDIV